INTTVSSSLGSIQKAVAAAPPQKYSPSEPGRRVLATLTLTPQPSEKPTPAYADSLNIPGSAISATSLPSGRKLRLNSATVLGLRICTPSSAPPFSIMQQKRK